ncbi:hypothetical protein GUJ93_ZPchr0007g4656 [Zizania palustris]|uniref:Uncharacterized protein n=1 Tax=Zizania palustris TaxID=103762 RepID=A0A8J5SUG4_ZIZPA|nr:hypothetical protein GUJ93_ZPchr0007g4656 [Zizania palustris]
MSRRDLHLGHHPPPRRLPWARPAATTSATGSPAVPTKGGVAKKTSTTMTTMTPHRRSGAVVKTVTATAPRAPPRDCILALPAPPRPSPAASVAFKKGELVGVRTHVCTLATRGQRLILWLGATVISAAGDDSHLERPTVTGKSLPLLKKLEPKMRQSAKAFLAHGSSSRWN